MKPRFSPARTIFFRDGRVCRSGFARAGGRKDGMDLKWGWW